MRQTLSDWCGARGDDTLLIQWDSVKNTDFTVGYSMNWAFQVNKAHNAGISFGSQGWFRKKVGFTNFTSQVMLFIDDQEAIATLRGGYVKCVNAAFASTAKGTDVYKAEYNKFFRHNGGSILDICWLDGHASSTQGKEIYLGGYSHVSWDGIKNETDKQK